MATSVVGEAVVWNDTTATTVKSGTGTGYAKLTSGVLSAQSTLTETDITLADNTTDDVSTTKHGFAPKAPNDVNQALLGAGAFANNYPVLPPWRTGSNLFYGPWSTWTGNTVATGSIPTSNRLYYAPFYVPNAVAVNQLSFYMTTGSTGTAFARAGIYNMLSTGLPGTVLVDGGSIANTTNATQYDLTISANLLARTWYFMAYVQSSSSVAGSVNSTGIVGTPVIWGSTVITGYSIAWQLYKTWSATANVPDVFTDNPTITGIDPSGRLWFVCCRVT